MEVFGVLDIDFGGQWDRRLDGIEHEVAQSSVATIEREPEGVADGFEWRAIEGEFFWVIGGVAQHGGSTTVACSVAIEEGALVVGWSEEVFCGGPQSQ